MKKSLETILFSIAGVAVLFVVLIAFNFLAGKVHARVDLTAEKAYTLSAGTRAILAKLDMPVKIRFYCTRGEAMPEQLKLYAQQVEDLLGEYRQASKGKIQIQKLDPEPDSDAEDSAKLDGVDGEQLQSGETVYLGLSMSMLDQKEAIPFLSPDREKLLEYDISRAISGVADNKKPVVGVMSPLAVAGEQMSAMMQGQQGQPAWAFYSDLQKDYNVKLLDMNAPVPDEVNVLVVIHPRGITPAGEYAIDQFILRGGKLLAFVDPCAVLDAPPGGYMPQVSSSTLPVLFKSWGIDFTSTEAVADMDNIARTSHGRMPGLMSLTDASFSKDDLVTADVSDLVMVLPGAFLGTPVAGLKETVLVKTSKNSQLVNPMTAEMSADEILNSFTSANKEFPLAVRLTGKFKTAFPDGAPKDSADQGDATKKDDKKPAPAPGLKESAKENTVILVGDTDFLQDQFAVDEGENELGARVVKPANGDLAFAENAVEQLTGDSNLIAIRSRATRERPFTVVEKMQEAAEASGRTKVNELKAKLTSLFAKLNDQKNPKDSQVIVSPEEQTKDEVNKEIAQTNKELRLVQRDLNAKTNSLENTIKWTNILAMPAIVAAAGIGIAVFRKKRSAAQ